MEGSKSAPLAKAWIQLAPTLDGSQRLIEKQLGGIGTPAGKSAGRNFGSGFSLGLKPIIAGTGALLAGGFAVDFAKGAIEEASNLGESLNAVDVVFKKNADSIKEIGESAAQSLGLSNVEFNGLAVQFGGFAKAIGGKGKGVVKFLDNITTRAADFASVMNLDVAEAAQLFQSGLAGETEPLRRFGIDLSAAAVEAFAYANGIAKTGKDLTEAQKQQARYELLMQETKQTAGDFANTSDSLANSQRILNAEWANAKADLGEKLLPVMTDVTHWMIDEGIPAVEGFIDSFSDPNSTIGGLVQSVKDFWDAIDGPLGKLGGDALTLGKNALDGATALANGDSEAAAAAGEAMTKWAKETDGPLSDFVTGIDNAAVKFAEAEAKGKSWNSVFGDGLIEAANGHPTKTLDAADAQALSRDIAALSDATTITSSMIDWIQATTPHTITADANGWGDGPQVINVYVDTVVSANSDDFVRRAQDEAKSHKTSGSRSTKPQGSTGRRVS